MCLICFKQPKSHFCQGASKVVASCYPLLKMPNYIKSVKHISKKKSLFRSKNTVHLSLLSFFFVMDFLDSFLGPRTPLIPRSRFAPSNPLEYSDITKDFWLILVS